MSESKLARSTGLYFEEFVAGDQTTSMGRTITEADVVNFAALSGDWNLIHTNAEYSKDHLFGQRVAHGLLVLSVASGLSVRLGFMEETILAFRSIGEWKFQRPGLYRRHRARAAHRRRDETHAAAGRRAGQLSRSTYSTRRTRSCSAGVWEMLVQAQERIAAMPYLLAAAVILVCWVCSCCGRAGASVRRRGCPRARSSTATRACGRRCASRCAAGATGWWAVRTTWCRSRKRGGRSPCRWR